MGKFKTFLLKEASTDNPAFKSWFAGSKIVDDQGNPKVVYHGSMADFDSFDYEHLGTTGRIKGAGFYFTDDEDVAKGYASERDKKGKLFKTYLKIVKPIDSDARNFNKRTIEKIVRMVAKAESIEDGAEIADGFLSNWGDIRSEGLNSVVASAVEAYADEDLFLDFQGSLVGEGINPKLINDAIYRVTGYDGIIDKEYGYNIYVPFFPNQIKSVDSKTFSDKSDNINESSENLSDTEKRILRNIHLTGMMGKSGNLTKKDRIRILQKLVGEGYLDKNASKLTKKGIEASV